MAERFHTGGCPAGMRPAHIRQAGRALGSGRFTSFSRRGAASTTTAKRKEATMSSTATETIQDAKPPRHKVTGDVHLVLRRGDTVLYGQRCNTGFEDGSWHLPAGHLEAGESVVTALIREAAEEIGVTIKPEDVQFSHFMHNSSSGGRMAIFFTVTEWQGEPENREPDKCSALDWFALDTPPDRVIDYCRAAMKHIAEGTPFSVYGW
ncbi:NUDIX hydrolase [Nocardia gipuzkoensis]